MKFYRVKVGYAKREFEMRRVSGDFDYEDKELLAYYKLLMGIRILSDLDDIYVKGDYLLSRGVTQEQIKYLVSKRILRGVEMPKNRAIGISLKNKYKIDPVHAARTRKQSTINLEKAWKAQKSDPAFRKKRIRIFNKARMIRCAESRTRRRLLKKMLAQEYGEVPERLSIGDTSSVMEKYPHVIWYYPEDAKKLYMRLFYDLRCLGVDTNCLSESLSKSLKKKLEKDPEYREFLIHRIGEMVEARKKLYEEKPEIKRESERKSAETRRRMMQEDEEFRSMTLSNLAKGNPAFVKKYRIDERFRKRLYKKQVRALMKGLRTIKRRAKERRDALKKWVIGPYFAGDPFAATPGRVESILNSERTKLRDRHYKETNLYRTLKRDITRLREEY